jgi:hypothetical protein
LIRRLNFTGRRKIPLKNVFVSLVPPANGHARAFEAEFDLLDLGLPPDAKVYVEAYNRSQYMRFDYGTVGHLVVPANRELTLIEPGARPLFRVKVVDHSAEFARILAVADKVVPVTRADIEENYKSLLHVEFRDIGNQIWKLELDWDWPRLLINERIDDRREIVRSDDAFQALVYPEVVRQILSYVLFEDISDAETDPDDWPGLWLRFARNLPNVGPPPQGAGEAVIQEKQEWIDSAVDAFSRNIRVLDKFFSLHPSMEQMT